MKDGEREGDEQRQRHIASNRERMKACKREGVERARMRVKAKARLEAGGERERGRERGREREAICSIWWGRPCVLWIHSLIAAVFYGCECFPLLCVGV